MSRPLVAQIDLAALRHNYRLALRVSAAAQAVAVIKANAYGHGQLQVAEALADLAPAFAVASIEEAETLHAAGVQQRILLLEGFFSAEELPLIFERGYDLVIHSAWQLSALKAFKESFKGRFKKGQALTFWLKVDSGMHRLGLDVDEAPACYAWLKKQPWVRQVLLTSHFSSADQLQDPRTPWQLARLEALEAQLGCEVSFANSAALLAWPQAARGWVRPGILLYGASPLPPGHLWGDQLQPVMSLKSRLISVRSLPAGEPIGYGGRFVTQQPTRVGVVACGYGDGYPRQARDGTPVWVKGHLARLAGRVSMDLITLDLTGVPNPQPGDEVELWGRHLKINTVAEMCDTISYTLMTGLLPRVPRVYCAHYRNRCTSTTLGS